MSTRLQESRLVRLVFEGAKVAMRVTTLQRTELPKPGEEEQLTGLGHSPGAKMMNDEFTWPSTRSSANP